MVDGVLYAICALVKLLVARAEPQTLQFSNAKEMKFPLVTILKY